MRSCRRWGFAVWVGLLALTALSVHAGPPPALMLAGVYHGDVPLAQYWVSEKYDGVHGYWNGHALISRGGELIHAPGWFTAGWPDLPMDGELWAGRGHFEQAEGTVRSRRGDDDAWRHIHYMVFDLPASPGTFNQRLVVLRALQRHPPNPYLHVIEQFHVADPTALQAKLDAVVAGGGEGLVLHCGDSLYRVGRTGDLLKFKPYDDAEARVVAWLPGTGRNEGRLGALVVERSDAVRFRLGGGFTDEQRRHPPAIGSWITYRYNGLTRKGLPRFARFVRVRKDLPPSDPILAPPPRNAPADDRTGM